MVKLFKRHKDVLAANPKVNAEKILASKYLWQFDRSLQAPVWGYPTENSYYRDASSVEMLLNVVLRLLPSVVAPAIRATEIRAAIRPYSIAVAPDSSFRKRAKILDMLLS